MFVIPSNKFLPLHLFHNFWYGELTVICVSLEVEFVILDKICYIFQRKVSLSAFFETLNKLFMAGLLHFAKKGVFCFGVQYEIRHRNLCDTSNHFQRHQRYFKNHGLHSSLFVITLLPIFRMPLQDVYLVR